MFQVASHPTSFSHPAAWEHNDLSPVTTPMRSSFNTADIQLPRTLQRPAYAEVSRDQIAAVSPDLLDVPAEYIRRGLRAKTPQYVSVHNRSLNHILTILQNDGRHLSVVRFIASNHLEIATSPKHQTHDAAHSAFIMRPDIPITSSRPLYKLKSAEHKRPAAPRPDTQPRTRRTLCLSAAHARIQFSSRRKYSQHPRAALGRAQPRRIPDSAPIPLHTQRSRPTFRTPPFSPLRIPRDRLLLSHPLHPRLRPQTAPALCAHRLPHTGPEDPCVDEPGAAHQRAVAKRGRAWRARQRALGLD